MVKRPREPSSERDEEQAPRRGQPQPPPSEHEGPFEEGGTEGVSGGKSGELQPLTSGYIEEMPPDADIEALHGGRPPGGNGNGHGGNGGDLDMLGNLDQVIRAQMRLVRALSDLKQGWKPPGPGPGPWPPGPRPPGPTPPSQQFAPNQIAIGNFPPRAEHVWFNTVNDQLLIWNWQQQQWVTVTAAVVVNPTPPGTPITIGQMWLDGTGRLWTWEGLVWLELTYPTSEAPIPPSAPNPSPLATSLAAPTAPAPNQLWLEPTRPSLRQWNGLRWLDIGRRPPRRVKVLYTPGSIETTGTWAVGVRAGDLLHISGMRGIDPVTNLQVPVTDGGLARITQAYTNMKFIAESEGASLFDCVRHMVFVTNMATYRPIVNTVQALSQFWGHGPYPTRTIVAVTQLNGADTQEEVTGLPRGDICEVQGTFFLPQR